MKKTMKNILLSCLTIACVGSAAFGIGNIKEVSADTTTPIIALEEGASARMVKTDGETNKGSGIRFMANLDRAQWQALLSENDEADISAGIILVPTDYITKAGGHTHEKLDKLNKDYVDEAYTEAEIGEETQYAVSLINLLDANYTRDFSGVAYLKSNVEIEGFTAYNGVYYLYASYNETDNSRNIYEVAHAAYNDRVSTKDEKHTVEVDAKYSPYDQTKREILQSFIDGVVDLKKNGDGDILIANNTDYYTSPYTVSEKTDGEWLVDGTKATVKGMFYNEVRQTQFNVKDEGTNVHTLVKSSTATVSGTNVTLIGDELGYGSPTVDMMSKMTLDYVAFNGNYEIGTYIDFYFQGNNMPQVMFFADELNGNITSNGGKGIICTNGIYRDSTLSGSRMNDWLVWGPNRIQGTYTDGGHITMTYGLEADTSATYPGAYPLLSQNGLKTTPDTNYRYTVGTIGLNGSFYIDVELYNEDTDEQVYRLQRKVTKKTLTELSLSGSIVAYASVKGEGAETTFSYGLPYSIKYNGATVSEDGKVTLKGNLSPGGVSVADLTGIDTSYVAFEGKYGLGTYMDFYFTGNNMPQVMFFADHINGDITQNGGNGVLLMNGMCRANASGVRLDQLIAFGPKRIKLGTNTDAGYDLGGYMTMWRSDEHASYPGLYPLLTQKGLSETPNTNYKYTVGMYGGTDGYLHIDIYLYNADDNTEIYHVDRKTTLKVADMPVTSGSIVAYAGYKGGGSGSTTAESTVFKYSQPYTK